MSNLIYNWTLVSAFKKMDGQSLETILRDLAVFRDSFVGRLLLPLIADATETEDNCMRLSAREVGAEAQGRALISNGRLDILRLLLEPGLGLEEAINKELRKRMEERSND